MDLFSPTLPPPTIYFDCPCIYANFHDLCLIYI
jgi:hypothetical protein